MKFQNLWSMLVAAGTNYQAQLALTKMIHELVGTFNKNAGKIVKNILFDRLNGGKQY